MSASPLLPSVVADLAARHHQPQENDMTETQPADLLDKLWALRAEEADWAYEWADTLSAERPPDWSNPIRGEWQAALGRLGALNHVLLMMGVTEDDLRARPVRAVGVPQVHRAQLLRAVAEGRREYAANAPDNQAAVLETQAVAFDLAARIVDGDYTPLYGLLPSWRWTAAMTSKMRDNGQLVAEDVAGLTSEPSASPVLPSGGQP